MNRLTQWKITFLLLSWPVLFLASSASFALDGDEPIVLEGSGKVKIIEVGPSEQEYQNLRYRTEKGDWPVAILRRLELHPIFGPKGSLQTFFSLNKELAEAFNENPQYQVPTGQTIVLPVKAKDLAKKEGIYKIEDEYVIFQDEKRRRQTNDYTRVLNLKNIADSHRVPASSKKTKRLARVKNKKTGELKWSSVKFELGPSVVRVPVVESAPLYKKLQEQGYVPISGKLKETIYVEVAVDAKKKQRQMAAVNTSQTQVEKKAKYQLSASTLTALRRYNVVDDAGRSGKIGIDPSPGFQIGFDFKYWLMDMESIINLQSETFTPDSIVQINQETDQRIEFILRQSLNLGVIDTKFGVGLTSTPGFVSTSSTSISSKHLLRPLVHLGAVKSFDWGIASQSSLELSFDYLLGASSGVYDLKEGYRGLLSFNNQWRQTPNFSLHGNIGMSYQDDRPRFYEQTQIGVQLLLGLQWDFGRSQ